MLIHLKNGSWLKNPPRSDDFQTFDVDESLYPTLTEARKFCRFVITDGETLVHLRNQLTFLLADLYGERHSSNFDTPFEQSVVFWAWIFLPSDETGPHGGIISHDVVYIKKNLSDKEIKKVQTTMRQLNMHVFARNVLDPKLTCRGLVPVRAG